MQDTNMPRSTTPPGFPRIAAPWVHDFDRKIQKTLPLEMSSDKSTCIDRGCPEVRYLESSVNSRPESKSSSSNEHISSQHYPALYTRNVSDPVQYPNQHQLSRNVGVQTPFRHTTERPQLQTVTADRGRQDLVQMPPGLSAPQGIRMGILPALQNGVVSHSSRRLPPAPQPMTQVPAPTYQPFFINRPSSTELHRKRLDRMKQEDNSKAEDPARSWMFVNRSESSSTSKSVSFDTRVISVSSQDSEEDSSWETVTSVYKNVIDDWEEVDQAEVHATVKDENSYDADRDE